MVLSCVDSVFLGLVAWEVGFLLCSAHFSGLDAPVDRGSFLLVYFCIFNYQRAACYITLFTHRVLVFVHFLVLVLPTVGIKNSADLDYLLLALLPPVQQVCALLGNMAR